MLLKNTDIFEAQIVSGKQYYSNSRYKQRAGVSVKCNFHNFRQQKTVSKADKPLRQSKSVLDQRLFLFLFLFLGGLGFECRSL